MFATQYGVFVSSNLKQWVQTISFNGFRGDVDFIDCGDIVIINPTYEAGYYYSYDGRTFYFYPILQTIYKVHTMTPCIRYTVNYSSNKILTCVASYNLLYFDSLIPLPKCTSNIKDMVLITDKNSIILNKDEYFYFTYKSNLSTNDIYLGELPKKYNELLNVAYLSSKQLYYIYTDESTLTSSDAITWEEYEEILPRDITRVITSENSMLGMPIHSNYYYYSIDGVTWEELVLSEDIYIWNDAYYFNNSWIINGYISNIFMQSSDGITWNKIIMPDTNWSNFIPVYKNSKYILSTISNSLIRADTSDCMTWGINSMMYFYTNSDSSSTSTETIIDYTYISGNNILIRLDNTCDTSWIQYTTDGYNWNTVSFPYILLSNNCNFYNTYCYENNMFIILCKNKNNYGYIYSYNGKDWAYKYIDDSQLSSIFYINNQFVIFKLPNINYRGVFISKDGLTWEEIDNNIYIRNARIIKYNNKLYSTVEDYNVSTIKYAESDDGINWITTYTNRSNDNYRKFIVMDNSIILIDKANDYIGFTTNWYSWLTFTPPSSVYSVHTMHYAEIKRFGRYYIKLYRTHQAIPKYTAIIYASNPYFTNPHDYIDYIESDYMINAYEFNGKLILYTNNQYYTFREDDIRSINANLFPAEYSNDTYFGTISSEYKENHIKGIRGFLYNSNNSLEYSIMYDGRHLTNYAKNEPFEHSIVLLNTPKNTYEWTNFYNIPNYILQYYTYLEYNKNMNDKNNILNIANNNVSEISMLLNYKDSAVSLESLIDIINAKLNLINELI